MAKQQPIKKFVSRNLSESIEKSVQDAVDSGIDVSELVDSISKEPTNVVARNYYNEEDTNNLVEQITKAADAVIKKGDDDAGKD